jgi:putative flippase GtrA
MKYSPRRLILFLFVGCINTVFGYGLFALLIFIGVAYPLALLIGTIAGIFFNFKTISVVVFKNHNNLLIFKFFGVYGKTYLYNLGGLALFKSFEINIYRGGAILIIPIGIIAFYFKTFVFKESFLLTNRKQSY